MLGVKAIATAMRTEVVSARINETRIGFGLLGELPLSEFMVFQSTGKHCFISSIRNTLPYTEKLARWYRKPYIRKNCYPTLLEQKHENYTGTVSSRFRRFYICKL